MDQVVHNWQIANASARTSADKSALTDEALDAFGERAAGYDRENRFFCEDL